MCLIGIRWEPEAEIPFFLVANRDEFYDRPSREGHFWDENPDVFGGKDLVAGGSWLGVSRQGRFAAVTNYREIPVVEGKRSRGALVHDFLCSEVSAADYLAKISAEADEWSGFNLLLADGNGLYYYSNRENEIKRLEPGVHVLCNHLLNTPWPKSEILRKKLRESKNQALSIDCWIGVMHDKKQAEEYCLPVTGVGLDREKLLSPIFIASENYGTCTTTLIQINRMNNLFWVEKDYAFSGESERRCRNISLNNTML